MSANLEPDPNQRSIEALDKYATDRWDTVLHYMVGSSHQTGISSDAVRVLVGSNLMAHSEDGGSNEHAITSAGFQFLLMDTPSQVI